ncbi:DUF5690 family protein [Salegentibacter maritimus]|uniref:DUF5690 family protein n=1 Tax=Salegentibacter maritimus TaxID=2794347 RepID=UPI001E342029|nr:DUF5690 family protein [Salegentibacter maritimus]
MAELKEFKDKIIKSSWLSSAWIMIAAFLCYTGMYAVRKSFLAGQYVDLGLSFDVDTKVVLVISQVLGYMLSKFAGIKIISEMAPDKRVKWLVGLVVFGLFMLGAFAVVPPHLKVLAIFLNGLPLGMVFGVVLSYIEGRRNTELLAAALSTTFIFSTGLVKTVGVVLIQDYGVSEYTMPFVTGLLFLPLFLIAVWMLKNSKKVDALDIKERSERIPMNRARRREFVKKHGIGFAGLVIVYVLLTIVRDFRDNFVVEFWAELGYSQKPALITLTEIPVAVIVLVLTAMGILIRKNKLAFNIGMGLTILGALIVLLATLLFENSLISPVAWMISTGVGVYLPYILFHCLIFERLIAFLQYKGNIGFLFYTADAFGYLGSVLVLLLKEVFKYNQTWVEFFINLNIKSAIGMLVLISLTMLYFNITKSSKKVLSELA